MINWKVIPVVCLLAAALYGCQKKDFSSAVDASSLDWEAISDRLLKQSNLQPGEHVLLVAQPGRFDSLITLLENKISKEGAVYLGVISVDTANQPKGWNTDFVQSSRGKSRMDLVAHFGEVDLGIMLPGASVGHAPYAAMQEVLNMGRGRTIHFHWSGAYDVSGQPIEITSSVDQLYQKVLLETDYMALARIQDKFDSALRKGVVLVKTFTGTNLKFQVGDRPVTKQNGNASLARTQHARNLIDREIELPAGAIRVAPLEESVEGVIAFPDGMWNEQKVEGLVLTFKKGKVVNIAAKTGQDAVKAELDSAGDAGYSFRELAVGFNPMMAVPKGNPWIPYYGYGAGIVRLSLGNNQELGGKVTGGYVRWNFFLDATLTVGSETWIKDGTLTK